ncbi:hypothetical protein ACFQVC_22350 [Streptomyces monticola]|uniref:Transferase n=1 Tax=Streptomyces monticola TaxID=2666263 RepID=A0ABW2JLF1_9ACTN
MTAVLPPPTGDMVEELSVLPKADCVADSAGGLTFDLADLCRPGAAHLLLRLRDKGDEGVGDETRLPLTPAADGRLRAVLPSSVELAEGRWDVYVDHGDGEPQRLVPGVNDLRSLVDRMPSGTRPHTAVRIPYATKHGNLTVRAWHRAPHAEAGELLIADEALTVGGRVFGTPLTTDAYAELRSRTDAALVHRAEVTADGADFGFTAAYAELAEKPGVWDLWLRPAGQDGPAARIGRLLDDVADKKAIFTYPAVEVGGTTVQPYYTRDNDLSVRVTATG